VSADLLVDTSVWIDVLRGAMPDFEVPLAEYLRARRVAVVGQVVAELAQGLRDRRDQEALIKGMSGLVWIDTDRPVWLLAGRLSAEARFRGRTAKLGDCVIAAAAKLNGCKVLSRDHDFLRIKGVDVELI
jgi:predicted nucleic acid-binding protein